MFYVSVDPNNDNPMESLYLLKDKNNNVVDARYATSRTDAINGFLRNHKELRKKDIAYASEEP